MNPPSWCHFDLDALTDEEWQEYQYSKEVFLDVVGLDEPWKVMIQEFDIWPDFEYLRAGGTIHELQEGIFKNLSENKEKASEEQNNQAVANSNLEAARRMAALPSRTPRASSSTPKTTTNRALAPDAVVENQNASVGPVLHNGIDTTNNNVDADSAMALDEGENNGPASHAFPPKMDKGKKRAREESDNEEDGLQDEGEATEEENYSPSDSEDGSFQDIRGSSHRHAPRDAGNGGHKSGKVRHKVSYPLTSNKRVGEWKPVKGYSTILQWYGTVKCTLKCPDGSECHKYYAVPKFQGLAAHMRKSHKDDISGKIIEFLSTKIAENVDCFLPHEAQTQGTTYRPDTFYRHLSSAHLKPLTYKCLVCDQEFYFREKKNIHDHARKCKSPEGLTARPSLEAYSFRGSVDKKRRVGDQ